MSTVGTGIVSSTGKSVTHRLLDEILDTELNEYKRMPGIVTAQDGGIFMQETTRFDQVTIQNYKSLGYFEKIGAEEDYPSTTIELGQSKALPVNKFAKSLKLSRDFQMDDSLFDVSRRAVRDLGRKAILTQDKNAFAIYRNPTSTDTLYTTGDGQALLSDSHVTLSGKTVDNKLSYASTDDLTDVIDDMIQSLQSQPNQDGTVGGWHPSVLLVPPAMYRKTYQAAESTLEAFTADNQLNYISKIFPGLRIVTTQFISADNGGSDTTMFLLADRHGVTRYVREGLTTDFIPSSTNKDSDHDVYKARYRELVLPATFEGIVGAVRSD